MSTSGTFEEFVYYLPANDYPQSIESLKGADTGFAAAVRTQQIVVYDDIHATLQGVQHGPSFTPTSPDASDCGSMICCPVKVRPLPNIPTIPLVITIKCDEPEIFMNRKRTRYKLLLQQFVDRICLEFYNEILENN